jgi:chemotaxis protein methyltransferase CheR
MFGVVSEDVLGRRLYDLGDGQWHIPALGTLLETIVRERAPMEGFEVENEFPLIGHRIMLLNARVVFYANYPQTTLLLAFEDVTARRAIEKEKEALLRQTKELLVQKDVLLREMEHRVGNSLQMIASILMLKARSVTSDETRLHLQDVYQRVMAAAAVQEHLHGSDRFDQIKIGPYLQRLCESLEASMIGDSRSISLKVMAGEGTAEYTAAVSLGLVVTELVINALKYAFPRERAVGEIVVSYHVDDSNWKLVVSDNGLGKTDSACGYWRRRSSS